MDKIDLEAMNLEFLLAQHRATPHIERPPIVPDNMERMTISLPRDIVRLIDKLRRERDDMPARSEMVRELVKTNPAIQALTRKE